MTDSVVVSEIRDPNRPSGKKKNKKDRTETKKKQEKIPMSLESFK